MKANKLRICLLLVLIVAIGASIYYYIYYVHNNEKILEGTFVNRVCKQVKELVM